VIIYFFKTYIMQCLPCEIHCEIFKQLQVRDLLNLRTLDHNYSNLLNSQYFIQLYNAHHVQPPQSSWEGDTPRAYYRYMYALQHVNNTCRQHPDTYLQQFAGGDWWYDGGDPYSVTVLSDIIDSCKSLNIDVCNFILSVLRLYYVPIFSADRIAMTIMVMNLDVTARLRMIRKCPYRLDMDKLLMLFGAQIREVVLLPHVKRCVSNYVLLSNIHDCSEDLLWDILREHNNKQGMIINILMHQNISSRFEKTMLRAYDDSITDRQSLDHALRVYRRKKCKN
jgi:hypothetical protein